MYKLYNPETKIVIVTRYFKWDDWKITNPAETLKMFRKQNKEDLVPGIEEDIIHMPEPEENMCVHVIPDEGERVRRNEIFETHQSLRTTRKS